MKNFKVQKSENGKLRAFSIKSALERARTVIKKHIKSQNLVNILQEMRKKDADLAEEALRQSKLAAEHDKEEDSEWHENMDTSEWE